MAPFFPPTIPSFWIFFSPLSLDSSRIQAPDRRQDCILGSMAFVALFFSVDGSAVAARSPEDCPVQQGTIWWYTFVALCPGDGNFKRRRLRQMRDAVILAQCYIKNRYQESEFGQPTPLTFATNIILVTGLTIQISFPLKKAFLRLF